jgi:hypothetical protein
MFSNEARSLIRSIITNIQGTIPKVDSLALWPTTIHIITPVPKTKPMDEKNDNIVSNL